MKQRMFTMAVLGFAMWLAVPQQAAAFGFRKKACESNCAPSCAPAPCAMVAGPCAPQATVTYVEKKVTAYKTETETKDVKVMVTKLVDAKEDYKFMVCEPVVTKSKVTVMTMQTKEETYKYTVMQLVPVTEKVKVASYVPVTKDVECITYDMVPVITKQKKVVCETVCVPVVVTKVIPPPCESSGGLFSKLCHKHNSCDAPCAAPCPQTVSCTVMQKQTVRKEIEVDVTCMTRVPKKTIKQVVTQQVVWTEKDVTVQKCVPAEKTGTRMVSICVPVEKVVDVTTLTMVEKTGTRTVQKSTQVEQIVKQNFTKLVPYETTVKVPVYTPAPVVAASPCAPTGMTAGCCTSAPAKAKGGFLHRLCGKCK
jgi:hypothetical protein